MPSQTKGEITPVTVSHTATYFSVRYGVFGFRTDVDVEYPIVRPAIVKLPSKQVLKSTHKVLLK